MRTARAVLFFVTVLAPASAVAAVDMSSVATIAKPAAGGAAWTSAQVRALDRAIGAALEAKTLHGAHVGIFALDTARATPLYANDCDGDFTPASNFKLLVGSTALHDLGTSFAFETLVGADARPSADGTLSGNVYLHGGGDALLSPADLQAAAAALVAAGVHRIDGALVTDASYFDTQRYGDGWAWQDFPYDYSPVVSALELDDGVAHVRMVAGPTVGAAVTLDAGPQTRAFAFDDRLRTGPPGSKDTSKLERPWDEPGVIRLSGSYPLGAPESGDIRAAVPDPQAYAGDVFSRALWANGIVVAGDVHAGTMPQTAVVLWTGHSEAMPQLLAEFWYRSDNLIGEMLLKAVGVAFGGVPGTGASGRLAEERYLRSIGIDPTTVAIADGSGLSPMDRITPRALVAILQADWHSPNRTLVLDALPVAGVRGTLRHAFLGTPAQGHVFAKTGSIDHVRTISGYVGTRTHGPVTFSLLVDDWMDDSADGSRRLERVRGTILSLFAQS